MSIYSTHGNGSQASNRGVLELVKRPRIVVARNARSRRQLLTRLRTQPPYLPKLMFFGREEVTNLLRSQCSSRRLVHETLMPHSPRKSSSDSSLLLNISPFMAKNKSSPVNPEPVHHSSTTPCETLKPSRESVAYSTRTRTRDGLVLIQLPLPKLE